MDAPIIRISFFLLVFVFFALLEAQYPIRKQIVSLCL